MNTYKLIWFILFTVLLVACHDDELPLICEYTPQEIIPCEEIMFPLIPSNRDTCYEIPFSPSNVIENQYPLYFFPTINPNNPNEFAYYRLTLAESGEHLYQLRIADLCTGGSTLLHEWEDSYFPTRVQNDIHWGKNDWITFEVEKDWKIEFIKSSGDSLHTFSETITLLPNLTWITDTTLYGKIQSISKPVLANINGTIIDTFDNHNFNYTCEYAYDQLLVVHHTELKAVDLSTGEEELLFDDFEGSISEINFINENEIYINDRNGMYKLNISTSLRDTLTTFCDNHYYFLHSTHPSRNDILVHRTQLDEVEDMLLSRKVNVALYNPETGEEWILDLD